MSEIFLLVILMGVGVCLHLSLKCDKKNQELKYKLHHKDSVIHKLLESLPILFEDGYKNPDTSVKRDALFAFRANHIHDSKLRFKIYYSVSGENAVENVRRLIFFFQQIEKTDPLFRATRTEINNGIIVESLYDFSADEIGTGEAAPIKQCEY